MIAGDDDAYRRRARPGILEAERAEARRRVPSPFPGMDPYLEAPELWPDVHQSLAFVLREQLSGRLRPRYVAMVHHEIEVEMRKLKHFRIEVREAEGRRLVAVVEILSRANKVPGRDRTAYEEKRAAYLSSAAHLIEIDLLRAGERWSLGRGERREAYRVLVSRARTHRDAEVWPVALSDPLPAVPLPLLKPDPDVPMDLGAAMARVYDGAGYDLIIDYGAPPPPPELSDGEAAFVRERTAEVLRRGSRRE